MTPRRRSTDQIAKPAGPWIVYLPGQPAEQHEHLISAALAWLRLRLASRSAASDVARHRRFHHSGPAWRGPARPEAPPKESAGPPAPSAYAEVVERELQLTYEGRSL